MQYIVKVDCMEISCGKRRIKLVQDYFWWQPMSTAKLLGCTTRQKDHLVTRWFKYDRDWLCVNKSQFVPVIFEPPCTLHIFHWGWKNTLL
jgi:hypothetical protein